jgi:regulator of nonsense transcripts 2
MDIEFVLSDSMEAVRPKLEIPKTLEEAAKAVDEMFISTFQATSERFQSSSATFQY